MLLQKSKWQIHAKWRTIKNRQMTARTSLQLKARTRQQLKARLPQARLPQAGLHKAKFELAWATQTACAMVAAAVARMRSGTQNALARSAMVGFVNF
jgi:hypothetical protein